MGIFLIFTLTGTIAFYDKTVDGEHVQSVFTFVSQHMSADPFTFGAIFAGGLTSVGVLLFIGATGKSAQIPLLTWLPDAMAGPTPVSALIHAATMVTAGVYLVVRANLIYQFAPTAMWIIAVIGAATALFAASIAIAQNDIKKVLAYSTVSQLGFMFLAAGVGAFTAAIFHVMTHAFFKALLFLGSGSVIAGMHHEQDMRKMGNLKKYMPITFFTMITGWLAICGIPFFSGFFSKDEILFKTFAADSYFPTGPFPGNYVLWIVGTFTALLTAVYMTRMMVMTFWGTERFHDEIADEGSTDLSHHEEEQVSAHDDNDHEDDHHALPADFKPHESPWSMTVPLIVLAVLATFGGFLGVPYALSGGAVPNYIEHTLEPVVAPPGHEAVADSHAPADTHGSSSVPTAPAAAEPKHDEHSPEAIRLERILAGSSTVLALLGIGIGFALFRKTPLRKMPKILEEKWRLDEFYNGYIVDPITNFSREVLWKGFDLGFIDGIVNGLGHLVSQLGNLARGIQVGFVRSYAAVIILGALALIGYFIFYGLRLVG
jgi:NADH-quinone oxidoreductase subunit L